MSAPTKCDKCGTTGTFAISVPCAMGCGGTMHYAVRGAAPAPSEAAGGPLPECCQAEFAKVCEGAEHLTATGLLVLVEREVVRLRDSLSAPSELPPEERPL